MTEERLQYLLDRIAIEDVLALYASAQDEHQGDDGDIVEQWQHVFTEDAILDYSQAGEPFGIGTYRTLAETMRGNDQGPGAMNGAFSRWLHLQGHPQVAITGDSATARTSLFAAHVGRTSVGTPWHLFNGAIFHDQLARTHAGWRIVRRRLEVSFIEVIRTETPDLVPELIGGSAS